MKNEEKDFVKISEETAQGLCELVKGFNESIDELSETLDNITKDVLTAILGEAARKFLDYMERYSCATFFTRWYWLRKARNTAKALRDIGKMKEDFFNYNQE